MEASFFGGVRVISWTADRHVLDLFELDTKEMGDERCGTLVRFFLRGKSQRNLKFCLKNWFERTADSLSTSLLKRKARRRPGSTEMKAKVSHRGKSPMDQLNPCCTYTLTPLLTRLAPLPVNWGVLNVLPKMFSWICWAPLVWTHKAIVQLALAKNKPLVLFYLLLKN